MLDVLKEVERQGGYLPACRSCYSVRGMVVACGQCDICLERKRVEVGGALEMEIYRAHGMGLDSCCVLLTFDDEHLPGNRAEWKKTGAVWRAAVRKFVALNGLPPLRMFSAGETGSRFGRPHFHVLFVGYSADMLASSGLIAATWKNGYVGFPRAAEAGTGYYLAKYLVKGEGNSPIYGPDFPVWPRPALGSPLADDIFATYKANAQGWRVANEKRDFPRVVRVGGGMLVLRAPVRRKLRELAGFDTPLDKDVRELNAQRVGDLVAQVVGVPVVELKQLSGNIAATEKRLRRAKIFRSAK